MNVTIKLTCRTSHLDTEGVTVQASLIAPRHLGLAAHRAINGGYWTVSDRVTGMMVGVGMTRDEARRDALDRLAARAGLLPITDLLADLRAARLREIHMRAAA